MRVSLQIQVQVQHSDSCPRTPHAVRPLPHGHRLRGAHPADAKQQGVSLVEALVAVLIVAFGVLGMLGMQLGILSDTRSSVQRAQAIRTIEDLSERVKSNPSRFAVLGVYVLPGWSAPASTQTPNCSAAACSAEQQAASDIQTWRRNVPLALPGAQAITFLSQSEASNPANRRQLGVMLAWPKSERADHAGSQAFSTPFAVLEGAGATVIACPDNMLCHLAYIQP